MQYEVSTPREYLEVLVPDWRKETLLEVRGMIRRHGPELKEGIRYGMLTYEAAQGSGLALNAQKHSVNLYVGNAAKIDPDGTLLAGLDVGKGCIRIKKTTRIGDTGIEDFIRKATQMLRDGDDLAC